MSDARIDALTERVDRLERQNARLRWIGGSLAVALLGLIGLGGAVAEPQASREPAVKALRARGFHAVDGQNRTVVAIGSDADPKSGGVIEFLDKAGRRRLALGVGEKDAPFLTMIDPARNEQVQLSIDPEKGIILSLQNRKVDSALFLGTGPAGLPAVGLVGEGGKLRLEMGVNPDGSAGLTVLDKDGKEQAKVPGP